MITYNIKNEIIYFCRYHIVFCPKYRRPVLTDGVDVRLKELITEICGQSGVEIFKMDILPDYVHLVLSVDPRFGVHKTVKRIKSVSSRTLCQEFTWLKSRLPSLWTHSYLVSTEDVLSDGMVRTYLNGQKYQRNPRENLYE